MQTHLSLGDEDASIAIEAIRKELIRRGKNAVIAVCDAQGETLGLLRMNGAALSSVAVATNKAFTAARLRRPSRMIGVNSRHPDTGFEISYYGDARYVGWPGGLPAKVGEVVVGAVGVSGLPSNEDEELAALGIAAIEAANRK